MLQISKKSLIFRKCIHYLTHFTLCGIVLLNYYHIHFIRKNVTTNTKNTKQKQRKKKNKNKHFTLLFYIHTHIIVNCCLILMMHQYSLSPICFASTCEHIFIVLLLLLLYVSFQHCSKFFIFHR